jgi:hypothetical protein
MQKLTMIALGAALLLASLPAEADDLRGGAFIVAMQRKALSGKMPGGTPFQLFILPGGEATVKRGSGDPVTGSWRLDDAGDICLKFPASVGEDGCYRVTHDGDRMRWSNKQGASGKLLGGAADLEMSLGQ